MSKVKTAEVTVKIVMRQHEVIPGRDDLVFDLAKMLDVMEGLGSPENFKEEFNVPDDFEIDESSITDLIEQLYEPESDKIEVVTEGEIFTDGDRVELLYQEPEGLGLGNSVTSVSYDVKEPGIVSVIRGGDSKLALIVQSGAYNNTIIETMGMTLSISVFGKNVRNNLTPTGGEVELCYTLESPSMDSSQYNKISITLYPRPEIR